jgi:MFS family permease
MLDVSMIKNLFRSLRSFNYRIWTAGALVSNVGTWMQRVAQDWIVLTLLTRHSATAVGVVTALQFAPQVVLLPLTGFAADHGDRRRLVFATQAAMGALALGLGLLVLGGSVRLWHVYGFALLLGCVTAFDSPARQTFVAELVGEEDLANAVALNSTSFNAARMIGPAIAGVLIASVGSGWVFVLNAASFAAVLGSLACLRTGELHRSDRAGRSRGGLAEGFRYLARRSDLKALLVMFFLIGTFGLNFPIFIAAMAVGVFHKGAGQFGLLTSITAIGSVAGALMAAGQAKPGPGFLVTWAAVLGAGLGLAAVMPSYGWFGLALAVIGIAAQTFTTTANSVVQLSTEPGMRGRVMAILLAIALGGVAMGAPIIGWVADRLGPRWALGVGSASAFAASAVGLFLHVRSRSVRLKQADGPEPVAVGRIG